MNVIMEDKNLKWNIRFPKGLLLSEKLTTKQKLMAIMLYENAHGRAKTKLTIDEIVKITGIKRSTVYNSLKKVQTIQKQVGENKKNYIVSEQKVTCKGKVLEYKLFYDNKAYQPIPQEVFDKLIHVNPELIVHYATLRYAHWYLTYKDIKQQLDIRRYVDLMGLSSVDEFNEIQLELSKHGILQVKLTIEFFDGLDNKTLE